MKDERQYKFRFENTTDPGSIESCLRILKENVLVFQHKDLYCHRAIKYFNEMVERDRSTAKLTLISHADVKKSVHEDFDRMRVNTDSRYRSISLT